MARPIWTGTIGFGLVGEIIIYTQARNLREYRIEKVYE